MDFSLAQAMYGEYYPLVLRLFGALQQLAIVALIALPFQLLLPGVKRRPKLTSYEYWLDVFYWHQTVLLGYVGFYVPVHLATTAVWGGSVWFPSLAKLPFAVQVLLGVWAYDFLVYWRHRLEHRFTGLWSFHAVHHSTEQVDVLTTFRLHPFELALGAFLNAAVLRMGMSSAAVSTAFAIYLNWNFFTHTNVRIRFPGFLKYVLVSPFMHQWHHAKDEPAHGKNVGVVFAWNDWLFGTAYHPKHWPTEFGISGAPRELVPHSYVRHILYPLQFAWARVSARRSPPVTAPATPAPAAGE